MCDLWVNYCLNNLTPEFLTTGRELTQIYHCRVPHGQRCRTACSKIACLTEAIFRSFLFTWQIFNKLKSKPGQRQTTLYTFAYFFVFLILPKEQRAKFSLKRKWNTPQFIFISQQNWGPIFWRTRWRKEKPPIEISNEN